MSPLEQDIESARRVTRARNALRQRVAGYVGQILAPDVMAEIEEFLEAKIASARLERS